MNPSYSSMSYNELQAELKKLEKESERIGKSLPKLRGVEQEMSMKEMKRYMEYINQINEILETHPGPTLTEQLFPTFSKLIPHKNNKATDNSTKNTTKETKTEEIAKEPELSEEEKEKIKQEAEQQHIKETKETINMFDIDKQKEHEEAQRRVEQEMKRRIEEEAKHKAEEERLKAEEEQKQKAAEKEAYKKEQEELIKNLDDSKIISRENTKKIDDIEGYEISRKKTGVVTLDLNDLNNNDSDDKEESTINLQHLKETEVMPTKREPQIIEIFADDDNPDDDDDDQINTTIKTEEPNNAIVDIVEDTTIETTLDTDDPLAAFEVDENSADDDDESNNITDVLAMTKESIIYDPINELSKNTVEKMSIPDAARDIERFTRIKIILREKLEEEGLDKDLIDSLNKKVIIANNNIHLLLTKVQ